MCAMMCQYGFVEENGCPVCQCNPAPSPEPPMPSPSPPPSASSGLSPTDTTLTSALDGVTTRCSLYGDDGTCLLPEFLIDGSFYRLYSSNGECAGAAPQLWCYVSTQGDSDVVSFHESTLQEAWESDGHALRFTMGYAGCDCLGCAVTLSAGGYTISGQPQDVSRARVAALCLWLHPPVPQTRRTRPDPHTPPPLALSSPPSHSLQAPLHSFPSATDPPAPLALLAIERVRGRHHVLPPLPCIRRTTSSSTTSSAIGGAPPRSRPRLRPLHPAGA